jgi:hydrogenase expression/formation protein HypC
MCLGIPMKLVKIDREQKLAQAETGGVTREISVAMMGDDVKEGDWVMVHTGFALEKLDYKDAQELLTLLDAVAREDPQWKSKTE